MEHYLFVYGTLKHGYNLATQAENRGMKLVMEGITEEMLGLRDLGGYPAIVPDAPEENLCQVLGELVLVNQ